MGSTGDSAAEPDFNEPLPNFPPPQPYYMPAERIPRDLPEGILRSLIASEYKSANIAAAIGGVVAIAGAIMVILGISGAVDLDFDIGSNNFHLKTSVVGFAMAVIGGLIIILTRPKLIWDTVKRKG